MGGRGGGGNDEIELADMIYDNKLIIFLLVRRRGMAEHTDEI